MHPPGLTRDAGDYRCMVPVPDGNQRSGYTLPVMEYKGIEYQVVQTANPTGWKWTVSMDGRRPRTGEGYTRAAAIALAQLAIDRLAKEPGCPSMRLLRLRPDVAQGHLKLPHGLPCPLRARRSSARHPATAAAAPRLIPRRSRRPVPRRSSRSPASPSGVPGLLIGLASASACPNGYLCATA